VSLQHMHVVGRSEQLYIVLKEEEGEEEEEEQQAIVVWKRLGLEPKVFSTNEVEDMIISTRPRLGGNKVGMRWLKGQFGWSPMRVFLHQRMYKSFMGTSRLPSALSWAHLTHGPNF